MGVLEVVGIVLITLKGVGVEPVASWPWLFVLAPFWLFIGMLAVLAFLGYIVRSENKKIEEKAK